MERPRSKVMHMIAFRLFALATGLAPVYLILWCVRHNTVEPFMSFLRFSPFAAPLGLLAANILFLLISIVAKGVDIEPVGDLEGGGRGGYHVLMTFSLGIGCLFVALLPSMNLGFFGLPSRNSLKRYEEEREKADLDRARWEAKEAARKASKEARRRKLSPLVDVFLLRVNEIDEQRRREDWMDDENRNSRNHAPEEEAIEELGRLHGLSRKDLDEIRTMAGR